MPPPRSHDGSMNAPDHDDLGELQRHTFRYFIYETNAGNGLVRDRSREGSPASVAAVGLALTCYPVGVLHGWLTREEAAERVLTTLRFFARSAQGTEEDATGFRGLYYHFLDMRTGRRALRCELSTMDSAILLAGVLACVAFFERRTPREREIRALGRALFRRADWTWALAGGRVVSQGWTPESGFLPSCYRGYDESLLLYLLALGSPTHPLPRASFRAFASTFRFRRLYGMDVLHCGPLFTHQLPHVWVDFRGLRDRDLTPRGWDYFENSRRMTLVHQAYAAANPRGFRGYGPKGWGITASDGPGMEARTGRGARFLGYAARGVPDGPDDGTLSPWAVASSLPFAPDIVVETLRHMEARYPDLRGEYGFLCSFNPSCRDGRGTWVAPDHLGLDQGPIVAMIENARTGFVWDLMKRTKELRTGLARAGFRGGWLSDGAGSPSRQRKTPSAPAPA